MSNYTKVNVRKDLYDLIKVKAAADGRSITNYIEQLLLADVNLPPDLGIISSQEQVSDLVATDHEPNQNAANPPKSPLIEERLKHE